jgi:hypothetical protein
MEEGVGEWSGVRPGFDGRGEIPVVGRVVDTDYFRLTVIQKFLRLTHKSRLPVTNPGGLGECIGDLPSTEPDAWQNRSPSTNS